MNWKVLFLTFLNFQLSLGRVDLAGTSALACCIWWLPSMDGRLHSPSRPGTLLHREPIETLLCDSQYAQLVRATAFERRRCFAFCFPALICSLHVSANIVELMQQLQFVCMFQKYEGNMWEARAYLYLFNMR